MKILVLGATGATGRLIVAKAIAEGHDVVALLGQGLSHLRKGDGSSVAAHGFPVSGHDWRADRTRHDGPDAAARGRDGDDARA